MVIENFIKQVLYQKGIKYNREWISKVTGSKTKILRFFPNVIFKNGFVWNFYYSEKISTLQSKKEEEAFWIFYYKSIILLKVSSKENILQMKCFDKSKYNFKSNKETTKQVFIWDHSHYMQGSTNCWCLD